MADASRNPQRGERIEQLMTGQGWRPAPLARALRVDRKRIYEWREGAGISSDMLERLAVALESTRAYIETGEGDPFFHREDPPLLLLTQLADAAAPDSEDD
jgi:transcriptional regulator with XRE-family HTH domain